ncbi:MAG: c-type cytochrome [Burkholderiales bacterium]|nr:c-type cytochrome [Burkholderiales bacterium]
MPTLSCAAMPGQVKTGEQVYQTICSACHRDGVAHAPKVGDRAAWSKLIAEKQVELTADAWAGTRAMPPKGGATDLSLREFGGAVAYMASQSGADWQAPDDAMMVRIRAAARGALDKKIRQAQAMRRELDASPIVVKGGKSPAQ